LSVIGFDRRDVVLTDAKVVRELPLRRAARLAERLQPRPEKALCLLFGVAVLWVSGGPARSPGWAQKPSRVGTSASKDDP
jgi:hypothetical protein